MVALLALSLVYDQYAGYIDEIDWYTAALDYDFSARVDSVEVYHEKGTGFLFCTLTSGQLNYAREDSLARYVQEYKRLRLLRFDNGRIKIFSSTANTFQPGDSVYINSRKDTFTISRAGTAIRTYNIRDSLTKRYL